MAKCKPCGNGKHDDDCEQLHCTCWCISEAVPFRGHVRAAPFPRTDLVPVLILMREAKMVCRSTKDEQVVYKPRPASLSLELRARIREHSFDLTRVLVAYKNPKPISRPLWTAGPTAECFGCKLSCFTIDPLGHARHCWCGWLGQKTRLPRPKPAPLYPNMASGKAVWNT